MLATRLMQTHDIRTAKLPVPDPGAGELLVRIEAAGICGTDRHLFKGPKSTFFAAKRTAALRRMSAVEGAFGAS